jgi:hypothetical protein
MAEGTAEKGGPVALELIGWGADSGGPRRDGLGLFSIDVIHHEAKLDRGAPGGPGRFVIGWILVCQHQQAALDHEFSVPSQSATGSNQSITFFGSKRPFIKGGGLIGLTDRDGRGEGRIEYGRRIMGLYWQKRRPGPGTGSGSGERRQDGQSAPLVPRIGRRTAVDLATAFAASSGI